MATTEPRPEAAPHEPFTITIGVEFRGGTPANHARIGAAFDSAERIYVAAGIPQWQARVFAIQRLAEAFSRATQDYPGTVSARVATSGEAPPTAATCCRSRSARESGG
jgi:hypothetical protein